MFKRLSLIVLLLLQFFCISAKLQNGATEQSEQRKTSKPYTGDLSIFDSPGRDERLQINRVMDILGIAPGKTVADIGAGSGWFTVRAAKRVRDTGTVYAVDINPEAIRYISARIHKENLRNIKPILGKPDNPLLPATVDAVLLSSFAGFVSSCGPNLGPPSRKRRGTAGWILWLESFCLAKRPLPCRVRGRAPIARSRGIVSIS